MGNVPFDDSNTFWNQYFVPKVAKNLAMIANQTVGA